MGGVCARRSPAQAAELNPESWLKEKTESDAESGDEKNAPDQGDETGGGPANSGDSGSDDDESKRAAAAAPAAPRDQQKGLGEDQKMFCDAFMERMINPNAATAKAAPKALPKSVAVNVPMMGPPAAAAEATAGADGAPAQAPAKPKAATINLTPEQAIKAAGVLKLLGGLQAKKKVPCRCEPIGSLMLQPVVLCHLDIGCLVCKRSAKELLALAACGKCMTAVCAKCMATFQTPTPPPAPPAEASSEACSS